MAVPMIYPDCLLSSHSECLHTALHFPSGSTLPLCSFLVFPGSFVSARQESSFLWGHESLLRAALAGHFQWRSSSLEESSQRVLITNMGKETSSGALGEELYRTFSFR